MKRQDQISFCILFCTMLPACSSRTDDTGHSFRVYEENGVTIAETTGGPRYSEPLFVFEEVGRLEQDEHRPESLLSRARDYFLGEDGRFYIEDRGNDRIAIFNADYQFEESFGRDGDGPGEFRSINLQGFYNNQIIVSDSRTRRTTILGLDGSVHHIYSWKQMGTIVRGLYPLNSNRLLVLETVRVRLQQRDWSYYEQAGIYTIAGDTIAVIRTEPYTAAIEVIPIGSQAPVGQPVGVHYGPRAGTGIHEGIGVYIFHSADPQILLYGLDGRLAKRIQLTLAIEPITQSDRDGIRSFYESQLSSLDESDTGMRSIIELERDNAFFPENKGYWEKVILDDAGYWWLQYNTDLGAIGEGRRPETRFRVLSTEGEYLGDVTFPVEHATISRGHLLTYLEDEETGDPSYIVFRMIPAVVGLNYPN